MKADIRNNTIQAGFIGVQPDDVFTTDLGYGWKTATNSFDSGESTAYTVTSVDLYRDGYKTFDNTDRTFQIQVDPAKTYDVRVYLGCLGKGLDMVNITAADGTMMLAPTTTTVTFTTVELTGLTDSNTDGILEISIANLGGETKFWGVNGMDVAETTSGLPVVAPLLAAGGVNTTNPSTISLTTTELTAASNNGFTSNQLPSRGGSRPSASSAWPKLPDTGRRIHPARC